MEGVRPSACLRGPYCGFHMCPGTGDVASLQGSHAGIVVKELLGIKVAGTLGAGEGFGVQRPGRGHADSFGVHGQALAQQLVVAELPGPLDRLGPQRPRSLRLAGSRQRSLAGHWLLCRE